jgi:hypothetical protein
MAKFNFVSQDEKYNSILSGLLEKLTSNRKIISWVMDCPDISDDDAKGVIAYANVLTDRDLKP